MRLVALALALLAVAPVARPAEERPEPPEHALGPRVDLKPPGELVPPGRVPARATDPEARYQELLDAQRRLEHRLEVTEKLAAGRAHAAPPMGLGPDGFYLGTAGSGFQLRLRGVIQSDGRFYADEATPAFTDAFLIRRARLYIEGVVANFFDFRLLPDFGQGQLTLFEAWVNLRPADAFQVRAGKMKSPFGLERLQAEQSIVFVERGLPSSLAPDRDVGVALHGRIARQAVVWHLALMNGVPDSGNADVEPSSAKDVAARVFVRPLRAAGAAALQGLGVGIAATLGRERATASAPALASYRTSGQQVFFAYAGGSAATHADGTRRRLSPQGCWYAGPVGVLAEYVLSGQEVARGSSRAALLHRAWQVQGSVLLTGDTASYEGVEPRRPFDLEKGQLGALELAARYGEVRIDPQTFPTFADPAVSAQRARGLGAALNWYFNRNVRFGLSVERTAFAGGAPGGDRAPELSLLERLQVSF